MGRQFRTPRRGVSVGGGAQPFVSPAVVTSSSTAIAIPNYGVTDIGAYAAGEYVLDAPETGSRKTIVCVSSTSNARVIRFSTVAGVGAGAVTCGTLAGTTGTSGGTQITFNATTDMCVVLLGINSTHWAIETMWPPTAANSTGIVLAAT